MRLGDRPSWRLAVLGAAVVTLVWRAPPVAAESTPDVLKVLSYNVHGLGFFPSQLGMAPHLPAKRMGRIATKLVPPVDLALLQEDFAYHQRLTRHFGASQIFRGGGPTFRWGYVATAPLWVPPLLLLNAGLWPLFNGDGLTTIAVNDRLTVERLAHSRYERCGDYFVTGGADCFAAKGFLAVRVTFPSGASVDVYNTHLEAGVERSLRREDENLDVRKSQLAELARAIEEHSSGQAVIVAGDLNSDASGTTQRSFAPVLHLMDAAGLADTGVWQKTGQRWRGKLDHILYRSGRTTALMARDAMEETQFARGRTHRPLSDHPAVSVVFNVAPHGTPEPAGIREASLSRPSRAGSVASMRSARSTLAAPPR